MRLNGRPAGQVPTRGRGLIGGSGTVIHQPLNGSISAPSASITPAGSFVVNSIGGSGTVIHQPLNGSISALAASITAAGSFVITSIGARASRRQPLLLQNQKAICHSL